MLFLPISSSQDRLGVSRRQGIKVGNPTDVESVMHL